MTTFHVETFQNEYLPIGGTDIDAIITVTSEGGGRASDFTRPPVGTAVVIIVDVSGSMAQPRSKIRAARKAAAAAVDALREGTVFGVIAGSHTAQAVFPASGLTIATPESRQNAKLAIGAIGTGGGTAISSWLLSARSVLAPYEGWIRQAILLTDGRNQDEDRLIDWALERCSGVFQCDCRGVGTDWLVDDLRQIAGALLGTIDIVAEPEHLAADFEAIVSRTMAQHAADVRLRISTPPGTVRRFVKQVAPTIEDLTERGTAIDANTVEYPLGAWGNEERDYHVGLAVGAQAVGDRMLAARVGVVSGDDVVANALVERDVDRRPGDLHGDQPTGGALHRTGGDGVGDRQRTGRPIVRRHGHRVESTRARRTARRLERQRRNTRTAPQGGGHRRRARGGTVRLKRSVAVADEMALDTRSTKTVRIRPIG